MLVGTRAQSVGVQCFEDDYTVRLVNNASHPFLANGLKQGRVQAWLGTGWGYVSSSGFTNEDAQVVCRQLKLPTVGAYVFGNVEPFVGNPGRLILPGLKCTGTESFLGDCPVDKTTATPTQEPAFIFCQEPTFAVRLAGGAHPSEGRLAVDVVCRQAGFETTPLNPPSYMNFSTSGIPDARPNYGITTIMNCPPGASSITQCGNFTNDFERKWTLPSSCASPGLDVVVKCYQRPPLRTDVVSRSLCTDPWSTQSPISPEAGVTAMLVGEFDDQVVGDRSQDVLLLKYGADGKLIGHAAFGRPWGSTFSAEADYDFGPTPKPDVLLLADMTGSGRDSLVAVTSTQVKVSGMFGDAYGHTCGQVSHSQMVV
ncbi:hypothetical protein CHLRE_10g451500v5 [Chlamydomonas reinhardtii]|uniref:SRCR domain-containing protein n=1 Tax=Chlamydomonas reinhardtii TaxID=3055 RepID=A0A2K3DB74_CHLRE|nr:uncharacterized protein CHLRE_10g451500v5 [Chlamydomonas reinhardtii]PNW77782.1 hypothetical protein CHLRE_10g451500v5 [Chlamydomonas reinhardtii]